MKQILISIIAIATFSLAINLLTEQGRAKPKHSHEELQVRQVDEEFRLAKLKNDTAALGRILADNFSETNQNGNSRNKAQMIELFTRFKIMSLATNEAQVRMTGDTAVVAGSQAERNDCGVDQMLFMRVYMKGQEGWQLLASMQFRDPKRELITE